MRNIVDAFRSSVTVFGLLAICTPAAAQITVTELPVPPTVVSSTAVAVNNGGQVAGSVRYATDAFPHPVIWQDGGMIELPSPCSGRPCSLTVADINDLGEVVGTVIFQDDGARYGVYWGRGTTSLLQDLGYLFAAALSINNHSDIVGEAAGYPARWQRFIDALFFSQPVDPLAQGGIADLINDAGDIIGRAWVFAPQQEVHVVRWRNGVITDLGGGLPGSTCQGSTFPLGMNESGQIVGMSQFDCVNRPVTWINDVIHPLPVLDPSNPAGTAADINERGEIVGTTGTGVNARATLWRNQLPILLGSLPGGTGQSSATDINDDGLIVGNSSTAAGFRAVTFRHDPNRAPSITLPSNITVDATAPHGATVAFSASGNDAEDGALAAACTPASGSTFAIGTTTVTCSVVDMGGLDASGTFTVTVRGAADQINELIAEAAGAGPGRSLTSTLTIARAAISANRPLVAAVTLRAFDLQVALLALTRRLPVGDALALLAASHQLRTTIGF
jgi:uncharacterized membrane protein